MISTSNRSRRTSDGSLGRHGRARSVRGRTAAFAAVSIAFALGALLPLGSPASATSAAAQAPASWTVSGETAVGAIPGGVTVTAALTGPGTMTADGTGLRISIAGCTASCGSLTYTFSEPVRSPTLEARSVGAAGAVLAAAPVGTGAAGGAGSGGGGTAASYHDHPITLRQGVFVAANQSSRMGVMNGGRTIGIPDPAQYVGVPLGDSGSCTAFGCGTYGISLPSHAVSTLAFDFGYQGTGTQLSAFWLSLGAVPAPATVQIQVASADTAGSFHFVTANLARSSEAVTTVHPGTPARSASPNSVVDYAKPVSLTEEPSRVPALSGASCIDTNAALSGSGPIAATLTGTSVTIPPADLVGDAAILCTFTQSASLTGTDHGPIAGPPTPSNTGPPASQPVPAPVESRAPGVAAPTPASRDQGIGPTATAVSADPAASGAPIALGQAVSHTCAGSGECTVHPVAALEVSLKGDEAAQPGAKVVYAAEAVNTGASPVESTAVIDLSGAIGHAGYDGDAPASADYLAPRLTWPLSLAPGQRSSISFTLTAGADTDLVIVIRGGSNCREGSSGPECTATTSVGPSPAARPSPPTATVSAPIGAPRQSVAAAPSWPFIAGGVVAFGGSAALGLRALRSPSGRAGRMGRRG